MVDETKQRILDTAERLFAAHGFDGTSLRAITAGAGVNIAAVNYHFRSKDSLIEAVLGRRIGPINRRRLEVLARLEQKYAYGPTPLDELLDAFIRPAVEGAKDVAPLLGRIYAEPGDLLRRMMQSQMAEIARRFRPAFRRSLPELPLAELAWRVHFVIGTMAHTLAASSLLEVIAPGMCDPSDTDAVVCRLVRFAGAGLRAPL